VRLIIMVIEEKSFPPPDPRHAGKFKITQYSSRGPTRGETQQELADWRSELLRTPTMQPRPLLANAITALRCAPEWEGVLAYDEFQLTTMALRPPPWLKHEDNTWERQRWTDRDDALTANWLQHQGISVKVSEAAVAAETVAKDATFHPIRDYLHDLEWDSTKRVAKFAETYLGAAPTDYHRAVSRVLFIAAVARIMHPGCKHDHIPILEGAQDKGKSTAIDLLFSPWFSDDLADLGTKDAAMQVRVAWGIEIAELAAMQRGDIEKMKAFVTRKIDRFRPSYGRRVIEVPRQSVFIGSTNADAYLKDETGGRRFLPIRCGVIDLAAIKRDRDQLWAEAVALFEAGEPHWLTETSDVARAREEQAERYQDDPWQEPIGKYVEERHDVSVPEILVGALNNIEKARWTQADQNRVARCLKALDSSWSRYRGPRPLREWRYRRGRGPGPSIQPDSTGTKNYNWDHQVPDS
jgi:predicted P-loop ATPase